MYISFRPALTRIRFGSANPNEFFPISQANVSYWHGASQAIYQGAQALGLRAGDKVLVPAYSCGSEADPLLKLGLEVNYYRILPTLTPDFDHLAQLCERVDPKALLVTHFFGLPQPMATIRAFVENHNLWLIEDNAHGLFGLDEEQRPLGSSGHIAVFSLSKSLPLPDGGVLVMNNGGIPNIGKRPSPIKTITTTIGVAKDGVMAAVSQRWPNVAAKINGRLLDPLSYRWLRLEERIATDEPISFEQGLVALKAKRVNWRMSGFSKWLLQHQSHDGIRQQRQHNFRYLLDNFPASQTYKPLFVTLPSGSCPLNFPIQASTPAQAEGLAQFLRQNHVIAYRWWSQFHQHLPTDDFPCESNLKQTVIVLPIHQDLNETHMQHMLTLIESGLQTVSERA